MIYGFTGTRDGMTIAQFMTVKHLFTNLTELHHGDAIGSDADADRIASRMDVNIIIHPPNAINKRAFCNGPRHTILEPKSYLRRNWCIVYAAVDGLIATPAEFEEPQSLRGQGTWTTINYARKAGCHLWIVFPDGTIKEEDNHPHKAANIFVKQRT